MKIFSKHIDIILTIFVFLLIAGIGHVVIAAPGDPVVGPMDQPIDPIVDPPLDPIVDPPLDPVVPPVDPIIPIDPLDPIIDPTTDPTAEPTAEPTADPTTEPTTDPTTEPTTEPTVDPTTEPTVVPTPDGNGTTEPTVSPTPDDNGTTEPTVSPTPDGNGTTEPTPNSTVEPTVPPASSGGGSSEENYGDSSGQNYGGGGGRAISASNVDPFSNIISYEVRESDTKVNQSTKYEFVNPEFGIYQVFVNSRENYFMVPMRLEHLKHASIYTDKNVPGLVYTNENVWIGTKRINYISVKFKINNSWMDENDISDKYIVSLLRWNGTSWLAYKITMTGTDDFYAYFESGNISAPVLKAGTASLSLFAISAFPKKVEANQTSAMPAYVPEEEVVYPDKDEIYVDDPNQSPGFDIVTVMFSIFLSIMIVRKIRKNT